MVKALNEITFVVIYEGDLGEAVRNAGLRFGLYYSLLEWFHPMYEADKGSNWATNDFPVKKSIPTLKELVNSINSKKTDIVDKIKLMYVLYIGDKI